MTIQIIKLHTSPFRFQLLCLIRLEDAYVHRLLSEFTVTRKQRTRREEVVLLAPPVAPLPPPDSGTLLCLQGCAAVIIISGI